MSFKDGFFENYASSHVNHRKGVATLEQFARKAPTWRKHFGGLLPRQKDARILDVGCGSGGLVWWLRQLGYSRAEGIDFSQEQVAAARRLGVAGVCQADLRTFLGERRSCYDLLIFRDVVEHFTREEVLAIMALSRDALVEGGEIILQVPNAESPFFGRIRYGDFTHELAFSASSLTQLFNLTGFTLHGFYGTEPVVHSFGSAVRLALWQAVKAFYWLLLFAELGRGRRILTQGIIAIGVKSRPEAPPG